MSKGEETREKIVRQAASLFNQRGFEGSSISDLMEATGLKKGGIYRHFASKEELAAEAFDYTWHAAVEARMMHVDEKSTGIERLKQSIASFIEHRSPIPGGCPVLNTAVDADDGNAVLRARVLNALQEWLGRLQTIVSEAAKAGEIRSDIDPKSVATLIVANLEGALMMSRLERKDDALRRVQQHLYDYLERDVAAPDWNARTRKTRKKRSRRSDGHSGD